MSKHRLLILISLIFFIPATPLQAEEEQTTRFNNFSTEQGLSHSAVNAITQDHQGFMWFGTQHGLNKYDGYQFSVYQHDPNNRNSLSNNAVWALHEDQQGMLWIGTNDGLNRFDPRTETFTIYRHEPNNPQSLSDNIIWTIYQDTSDILWIGTDNGGLNKFDPETETFTTYRHNPNNPNSISDNRILVVHEDQHDQLWVGTWDGGLNKFDPKTETFTTYLHDPNNPNSLSNNRIQAIHEDRQGMLWIGTWEGGLNKFDPITEEMIVGDKIFKEPDIFGANDIRAIHEDQQGFLWIGTWENGLYKFDPDAQTLTHLFHANDDSQSLGSNYIRTIYEDRSGLLWVGMRDGGVAKSYLSTNPFSHHQHDSHNPQTISDNDVRAVLEDPFGNLWIGTTNGLNQLDSYTGELTQYLHDPSLPDSLSHNQVNALYHDPSGILWVGTSYGLNKLNPITQSFIVYTPTPYTPNSLSHEQVNVIYADRMGALWIGTNGGGLNRFDHVTGTFTHFDRDLYEPEGLNNNFVRAIYEDKDGILWVGTNGGGLNRFDRLTETFTHFIHDPNNSKSLSHNQVNVIYEDRAGTLWIGTNGGGLNSFDTMSQTFIRHGERDGMSDRIIQGITEDDNDLSNLWISTDKGLVRFNPDNRSFLSYGLQDDLPFTIFNRGANAKRLNGELVFGGPQGFTTFVPDQISNNSHQPPVVITAVRTNNESFVLDRHASYLDLIELSYQETRISFEFAALDFGVPEDNLYSYMLEGYDQDWIDTDAQQRVVTYTNLNPGYYTFKVLGSNNDGVWNTEGVSIDLIIQPPPWQTWWAYSLYALFFCLCVFAYIRFKTQAQTRELTKQREINEILERRVTARTQRLEMVATLSEQLNAILDIDRLLLELVNQVKNRLAYYHAQVYMLDERGQNLILKASADSIHLESNENGIYLISLARPNSLLAQTARTGEVVIVANVLESANWMPDPLHPHTKSEICVPIIIHEQVVGVLDVQEDKFMALDDSDANLLRSLANQVGVAIENAKLYSSAQHELAEREKLIAELDAFSYTVAHDFQNPLSIIIAYAELLDEEWSTSEDLREASEAISRNGHKLKTIVRELLLLAKMRNLDVELRPLDMGQIVAEAQQTLCLMIDKQQAEIVVPNEWPIALGYAPWIEEVWSNYLSNALKYGGTPPRIELGADRLANNMVYFWIRDNGDGVSEEEQAELFLPFVQLSRGRVEGGYGLGLSIVQRIIEKLGGEVHVESSGIQGDGSIFSFTLPASSTTVD